MDIIKAPYTRTGFAADRQIVYWDIVTGRRIREMLGAKVGAVNTMDISDDGQVFVTGGEEKILKIWNYPKGKQTQMRLGHSAPITMTRISPDMSLIVSAGEDGAILQWNFPKDLRIKAENAKAEKNKVEGDKAGEAKCEGVQPEGKGASN